MSKLTILTQFYPPDYAATGQLIEELAQQFSDQNLKVTILTGQPAYSQNKQQKGLPLEQNNSLTVRRSRTSRLVPFSLGGRVINSLLFCVTSLGRLIHSRYRGDVVLLTTEPPYLPIIGYLAKLLFNISYVCLIYDLYPDILVQLNILSQQHWLTRFWNWLNFKTWRQAKGIIVLSSTMKQRITAKDAALAEKITVIHSWSDPDYIKPKPKADNPFAIKHNLVDSFTVLYSGNMGRCHDLETIRATIWELKDDSIKFVFIGNGTKYKELRSIVIEQWNLASCLFLPFQSKQNLPDSLTACDLSLVTIQQGMEGLIAPSKLYGILAAGSSVAAICEKDSYLAQLLKNAGCGQSFVHGDSKGLANYIRFLKSYPEKAQTMGAAGRQYLVENYTPAIISQQYLNFLLK